MGQSGVSIQQVEGAHWVAPDIQEFLAEGWREAHDEPYTPDVAAAILDMAADDKAVLVLGRDASDRPSSLVLALLPTLCLWPKPQIALVHGHGDTVGLRAALDMAVDILRGKGYNRVRTAAPVGRDGVYRRFGRKYGPSRTLGTMIEWEIG